MTEQLTEQLPEEHPASAVPAGPVTVPWATVARVNLLPLEIIQGRRLRRTKQLLLVLVFAGIVLAAAGTYLAQREVSQARDDLTVAQSRVTTLQTEAGRYSAVPAVVSQVEAAAKARADAMARDVLWYQFMNDLEGALPAGVTQDSVTVALTPATGAAGTTGSSGATGGSPLAPGGVGTLTVSGDAGQYQEISSWLDGLAKVNGISSPSLANATKTVDAGVATVTYSISAVVTDTAFSHRYDKEGS